MITEAIAKKDGIFIKGYKPPAQGKRITVKIEQLPETAVPVKCRGMLSKNANKDLIPAEKNAWKSKATA